jgi:hypothetical protein
MPSNGEDLSNNDKISEASNNDDNGGSGGGVRDKRGDNGRTSTSSGESLPQASGDGITRREAVTINGNKLFEDGKGKAMKKI